MLIQELLVFVTELTGIWGIESESPPESESSPEATSSESIGPDSTASPDSNTLLPPEVTEEDEEAFATIATISPTATSTVPATGESPSPEGPLSDQASEDDGECHLLGPFALFVQAALGLLAVVSLVWKRYRERPRRPLLIWFFDASKQVFGSALLHLVNLAMSMLGSGTFDVQSTKTVIEAGAKDASGRQPNPCSFYLLNLAIDVSRRRLTGR